LTFSQTTNRVSFRFEPNAAGKAKGGARKDYEAAFVSRAVETLQQFHMCVLHDALSPGDVSCIDGALLDVKHGAHAIGEKDSSKRSGTRMW
jgi:hypothetical protein